MLACAVEDGDIGSNPAAGVRYVPSDEARLRHPRRKRKVLMAADVKAILQAVPDEWRAFFTLLTEGGPQRGAAGAPLGERPPER
jgi:hypothetical protein